MKAIYFFLFSLCLQAATAQPLQRVAPEQVGMDSRKLMYADEAIETAISNKDIPGAVLAVVRNGKMAYLKAYGNKRIYPNVEPMTANTIFDMASCQQIHVDRRMYDDTGRTRQAPYAGPRQPLHTPFQELGKRRRQREKGNPHCRFDDTHFRSSSLCTGSRARKAVRFSQS